MKNNEINNIHWHDCELKSVIEIPNKDMLIFNIQYPENWEENIFSPKSIVFEGYYYQKVDEIPFEGNPTILNATILDKELSKDGYIEIHIETNAENRFIIAKTIKLINEHTTIC